MKTINKYIYIIICNILFTNSEAQVYSSATVAQAEFDNHSIDVNKKVLKLDGTSSVSPMGAFNYSFNIEIPKGVNNLTPKFGLNYNSNIEDNILGMGWYLDGMSMISRTNQNFYFNGKSKEVNYSSSDPYELDGQRIQPKNGNNGQNGEEYEFENESYINIKSYGAFNSQTGNPEYFEVTMTNGNKYTYGRYNNAVLMNPSGANIVNWYLSRIEDNYGNYIDYSYNKFGSTNELVLESIKYGGNLKKSQNHFFEIKLDYIQKPLIVSNAKTYINGVKYVREQVLTNIQVIKDNNLIRKYNFNYYHDNLNSYLCKINLENPYGETLNPIMFSYDKLQKTSATMVAPQVNANDKNSKKFYFDYDGDAIQDLIELEYDSISIGKFTKNLVNAIIGNTNPSGWLFKPSKLKFYKNNYNGNKSLNTNFTLKKTIDLKTLINAGEIYSSMYTLNFNPVNIDYNSNGINDLVFELQYIDNNYQLCNLPYPANTGYQSEMRVFRKMMYFEYSKITNDISVKSAPTPNLPTIAQLGLNPNNGARIINTNSNTDPFWLHRYFPKTLIMGDFDGDGFNDYINCLQLGVDDNSNNGVDGMPSEPCEDILDLISRLYISYPKNSNYNNLL